MPIECRNAIGLFDLSEYNLPFPWSLSIPYQNCVEYNRFVQEKKSGKFVLLHGLYLKARMVLGLYDLPFALFDDDKREIILDEVHILNIWKHGSPLKYYLRDNALAETDWIYPDSNGVYPLNNNETRKRPWEVEI